MATESVTKAVEFDHAPAYPCGLFQVNAGVDSHAALSTASILQTYVRERLSTAVESGFEKEEPLVLSLLTDMSRALYRAAGAEA